MGETAIGQERLAAVGADVRSRKSVGHRRTLPLPARLPTGPPSDNAVFLANTPLPPAALPPPPEARPISRLARPHSALARHPPAGPARQPSGLGAQRPLFARNHSFFARETSPLARQYLSETPTLQQIRTVLAGKAIFSPLEARKSSLKALPLKPKPAPNLNFAPKIPLPTNPKSEIRIPQWDNPVRGARFAPFWFCQPGGGCGSLPLWLGNHRLTNR